MIDERMEELMWQQIDGEISSEDRARLEAYMSDHSEARGHFRELTSISEALGKGEEMEAPAALRPRIEAAIDWRRYASRPAPVGGGWLQRLFPSTGWDLRVVPVAIAAFILGIAAYQLAGNGGSGTEDFRYYGAMAPTEVAPSSQVTIDLGAVQGTVEFRESQDVTVSEITVTSDREIEVQLRYEGESLEFGALGGTDSPLQGVSLEENALTVRNLGANKYYFVFRSNSREEPVRVRVTDESGVLLEREWTPGRPDSQ